MEKDSAITFRINGELKRKIETAAKKQGITTPTYMINALTFYGGFDKDFLNEIQLDADKLKLPMPTVIQQLLMTYLSTESAIMCVFKTGSKTYKRAFQYDENGLIEGKRHTDLVHEQVSKEISALRKKLENAVKAGKPVLVTRDDAALMTARL